MSKAVVLLSGGLDSSTSLFVAMNHVDEVIPISFDYGQRHKKELKYAARLVEYAAGLGRTRVAPLRVVHVDFSAPGSALTDSTVDVPVGRDETRMAKDIPVTYVPGRNSMFLAVAVGMAEAIGADKVYTGFNAVDYSGYPDCRPEFVQAMELALSLGTKRGVEGNPVRIVAPIIRLTKVEIVKLGNQLGVPFDLTWSCYQGDEDPCHKCDSCVIRDHAFRDAGV